MLIKTPVDFWAVVERREGACWQWRGRVQTNGYGVVDVARRKQARAHRFAWELTNGPIPAGRMVLHECDNKLCVNPSHLFLGDATANMRDMARKGRHGRAKLTADTVRVIRARRASGESLAVLAGEFGVTQSCISCVARRLVWAHVDPPNGDETRAKPARRSAHAEAE